MDSPAYAHGYHTGRALRRNDQAKRDFDILTAADWVAKYCPILEKFANESDFWGGVAIGLGIA